MNNKIEVLSSLVYGKDLESYCRHQNYVQVKYDAVRLIDLSNEALQRTSEEFNFRHEFVKSCENLKEMNILEYEFPLLSAVNTKKPLDVINLNFRETNELNKTRIKKALT